MPTDKIVKNEVRHFDRIAKDLFRSPHVIAKVIQTAIPEFSDLTIEEIIDILPVEGKTVHFDMQETSDSEHKDIIGDLKFTIDKVETIENIKNGAKIGIEIQTSKLYGFESKARKTHYIASQISEQTDEYKNLKESYLIWIFVNPNENFKDEFILSDHSVRRLRGFKENGIVKFEHIDKEFAKPVLTKEEVIESRKDSFMHEVEIYVSNENTDELDLFQFIRELLINKYESKDTVINRFSKYGWDLDDEEEDLMEERMSLFDVAFYKYKEDARQELRDEFEQEIRDKVEQEKQKNKLQKTRIFESLIADGYPEEKAYKIVFEDNE